MRPTAARAPAPTFRSRVLAFAELRDAVFFGGTGLYVLGYATWALYSADHGLGVLPPLEGQYFLAGVVPLALIGVAAVVLWSLQPARDASSRQRAGLVGDRVLVVAAVIIASAFLVSRWWTPAPNVGAAVMFAAVALTYVGQALKVRSGERGSGWMRWIFRVTVPLLVVAAGVVYATRIFPLVPSEFGGPEPKCIALDLSAKAVSRATLLELGADSTDTNLAVRTAPLWLHFSGGGMLVVSRSYGRPVPTPIRLSATLAVAMVPTTGCA